MAEGRPPPRGSQTQQRWTGKSVQPCDYFSGLLEQLKRLWAKADAKEQGEFRDFINPVTPAVGGTITGPAFRPDGSFEPWARSRVREIMDRRVMESGDVCREIGINTRTPSIGMALHRNTRIKEASTRAKLERWISDNVHV